jgi:hypothetical protein
MHVMNACMVYVGVRRGYAVGMYTYIHVVYPPAIRGMIVIRSIGRKRLHHREETARTDKKLSSSSGWPAGVRSVLDKRSAPLLSRAWSSTVEYVPWVDDYSIIE